ERFRPRPGFEIRLAPPDRVGRIEHMILALRPAQQMKLDKARYLVQMGVASGPDTFELRPERRNDFESVHRYEHVTRSCSCLVQNYILEPARRGETMKPIALGMDAGRDRAARSSCAAGANDPGQNGEREQNDQHDPAERPPSPTTAAHDRRS